MSQTLTFMAAMTTPSRCQKRDELAGSEVAAHDGVTVLGEPNPARTAD